MNRIIIKLAKEWENAIWNEAEAEIRRTSRSIKSKIGDNEFEELVIWIRNRMVESLHFGIYNHPSNFKASALWKDQAVEAKRGGR